MPSIFATHKHQSTSAWTSGTPHCGCEGQSGRYAVLAGSIGYFSFLKVAGACFPPFLAGFESLTSGSGSTGSEARGSGVRFFTAEVNSATTLL